MLVDLSLKKEQLNTKKLKFTQKKPHKKLTFDKCVLVCWGWSGQDSKFRPHLVNTLLFYLNMYTHKFHDKYKHGHLKMKRESHFNFRFVYLFSSSLLIWQHILYLAFLITDPPVELFAINAEEVLSGADDPALDGYGSGRVYVVACHHAHSDACTLTLLNGIGHLKGIHIQIVKTCHGLFYICLKQQDDCFNSDTRVGLRTTTQHFDHVGVLFSVYTNSRRICWLCLSTIWCCDFKVSILKWVFCNQ